MIGEIREKIFYLFHFNHGTFLVFVLIGFRLIVKLFNYITHKTNSESEKENIAIVGVKSENIYFD